MEKLEEYIKIPVFHYEDEVGHSIIDRESMIEYFDNEIRRLILKTKNGRREYILEYFKDKNLKQNK